MCMKLKDFIEELKNFNENDYVSFCGGEGVNGGWATLKVCKTLEDALFDNGIIIIKYEEFEE